MVNQQDTHWAYASQLLVQLWIEDNKQEHIQNSNTHWAYASQLFFQLWIEDNKQEYIQNSRDKS